MTLHFNQLMLIGLLLMCLLASLDWELGSLAGFVPGIVIVIAGIAIFLVGLGQELH